MTAALKTRQLTSTLHIEVLDDFVQATFTVKVASRFSFSKPPHCRRPFLFFQPHLPAAKNDPQWDPKRVQISISRQENK